MKRPAVGALALVAALSLAGERAAPADPRPSLALPNDPVLAIATIDRKIADLDASEQSEKAEIGHLGTQVAAMHQRVILRGRAFYRLTRAGLLPVGGGFRAFVSHAMYVERARRVLASDIDTEMAMRDRAADLARDMDRILKDRSALQTDRATMDAAQTSRQDDERRQSAFDKAFETSTGASSGYVAVVGGGGGGTLTVDTPAGGFATARGHLLIPVSGRAEISSVRREGTEGPGLEIRAPAGSGVRAVFAGHVAFADRYGPYGRIVILDHGDHYYTVSGNLDAIDVKIGQDVAAGERIGTVGDDGHGSLVYFEVRHNSRTIAPEGWLGL
ncbi:MAG TPA: peptidoglycan DD-metalloendopeptidase family protein [Polyangiaceae bacterium]|jgi:murein DD-endopeptidase MepM/ murein hydrolase activator NlpD